MSGEILQDRARASAVGARLPPGSSPMNTKGTTLCRGRWLPKTVRGRVLFGLGLFPAALSIAAGFVVFSVWIENRFPSGDPKRALAAAAQRVVTKPVVNSLTRQVERYVRSRAEASYMNTGLTLEETIRRFLDERLDFAQRRIFAYRLARVGSPECIAALVNVFRTATPEDKAFMAQLIGSTRNPAAKGVLWLSLDDPNERVAIATMRGLSAIGGDDVAGRIAGILADSHRTNQIRIEAALALGTVGTPVARRALVEAFEQAPSNELTTQILNSLGRFEFSAVANTFAQYLTAPETPPEMRVAAIEALSNSSEAVPFLLELAEGDADAAVRASAAWAISAHNMARDLGPALADLVERETDADVRRRLYEAFLPQTDIPAERLLAVVQAENDIAARVAGFNAIGRITNQRPASAVATAFDEKIVPELVQIATAPNSLNIQMRAVFALRRAQTAAAQTALATIANSAPPQVATAARHGL